MPRRLLFVLTVSFFYTVRTKTLFAQTVTPTPPLTPTPTPWWAATEGEIPYALLLLIGLIIFLAGTFARPLLEDLANALQRWVWSWGKAGNFRKRYLDWVVEKNRFDRILLPERVVMRMQHRRQLVALEELYTPVALGTERHERETSFVAEGRWSKRLQPISQWLRKLWQRIRPPIEPSAGEIGDLIQSQPRLVIRGDPGSGKTTLLRYLAISCARTLRRQRIDGDDYRMVLRRFGWKKSPFPIIVPLNLLADVGDWPPERRLLDAMIETLDPELRRQYPANFFERRLAKGHCLVLFDGFDELGSRSARGKMAQLIADLTSHYQQPTNRFVVSTRIVGYEAQLDAFGFLVRTVQPLDDDTVKLLVERRYRAIALTEGLGQSAQAQGDLLRYYAGRTADLLTNVDRNLRLRKLTANPLLLSLIVLVHSANFKLPDERHLLYRDCVNMLAEGWQEFRRTSVGLAPTAQPVTLALDHKLVLLRAIALTMQQQRQLRASAIDDSEPGENHPSESQALIRRDVVEALIAERLPNFIADELPPEADKRTQICERRATALLDDIRENSQILAEKGFDAAGEPVVGFSHLTFQEYLAADAVRETPAVLPQLLAELFNPTWREVLLLYVSMVEAGPVIRACLAEETQLPLARYLLAGRCLAEKVNLDPQLREQVVSGLHSYFAPPDATEPATAAEVVARLGGEKRYDWLIGNLCAQFTAAEKAHFAQAPVAGQSFYTALQTLLLRLLQDVADTTVRYYAGCTLSAIGDPRDLDAWVTIPAGEFIMGSDRYDDEKPLHRMMVESYKIGKHPVTNAQYQRFVEATGHRSPDHWRDDKPAPWQATHPVIYVSWDDAQAYCRWLSDELGTAVRLPTEAEWERAARGTDGREWPWGNTFDANCANTYHERGEWTTTPVGMYPLGASPEGALDMAGNVWEWTATKWLENYANYATLVDNNPEADAGARRVVRGGSWDLDQYGARAAFRYWFSPDSWYDSLGFRVVVSVAPQ